MKMHCHLMLTGLLLTTAVMAQPKGANAPTGVVVAQAVVKAFYDELEALGTLRAKESVDLTSTVTEYVTKIHFDDNARVRKGDVLIDMDTAEEEAELMEEKANYRKAQKQIERLEPLERIGSVSTAELDEWKRELQASQGRIQAIEARMSQRRIVAPFDGVVGLRNISVGALVQPGTVITTIDDDQTMKLDFSVPSLFLSTTKPGVKIKVRTKAFPDETFTGTVSSVDSRIDPVTRSILVRALLGNGDRKLKPGLLMNVVLQKNVRNALVVPEEALLLDGDQNYVLAAVKDGSGVTAKRKNVSVGTRKNGLVEITEGLAEGDQVVTHGLVQIRPGSPITIQAVQEGNEPLTDFLKRD